MWLPKRNSRSILKVLVLGILGSLIFPWSNPTVGQSSDNRVGSSLVVQLQHTGWVPKHVQYNSDMSINIIQKAIISTLTGIYKELNCRTVFQLSLRANDMGNKWGFIWAMQIHPKLLLQKWARRWRRSLVTGAWQGRKPGFGERAGRGIPGHSSVTATYVQDGLDLILAGGVGLRWGTEVRCSDLSKIKSVNETAEVCSF